MPSELELVVHEPITDRTMTARITHKQPLPHPEGCVGGEGVIMGESFTARWCCVSDVRRSRAVAQGQEQADPGSATVH